MINTANTDNLPLLMGYLRVVQRGPSFRSCLVVDSDTRLALHRRARLRPRSIGQLTSRMYTPKRVKTGPTDNSFGARKVLVIPYDVGAVTKVRDNCTSGLVLHTTSIAIGRREALILTTERAPLDKVRLQGLCRLSVLPKIQVVPPVLAFCRGPRDVSSVICRVTTGLLRPFKVRTGRCHE